MASPIFKNNVRFINNLIYILCMKLSLKHRKNNKGEGVEFRKAFNLYRSIVITLPKDFCKSGDYIILKKIGEKIVLKRVDYS